MRWLAILLLAPPALAGDVREQFLLHCASCHGETGDGHGTATLDRPARSFLDGGFSYGNTPEAIFRTITHGIPGTPMPAAPSVLSDADRAALAEYVISLGPKGVTATVAESTLVVRDRAVVARGKLPPVARDLPERPRGLLLGTPDGLSFEYRTDDVRLLAVRQGGFVDRRDWRGRGGEAIQPLGAPIHLCGGGDPGPGFLGADGAPLAARFLGSFVDGARGGIRYRLQGSIDVDEEARGVFLPFGSGFERVLVLRGAGRLTLRLADPGPAWVASGTSWTVRRRADGVYEAIAARGRPLSVEGGRVLLRLDLGAGGEESIAVRTLLFPAWDRDVEAAWIAQVRS